MQPLRIVAVAPTFNNARTLRDVLDAVVSHGLAVIVVNDGSTDETADELARWLAVDEHGRQVLQHPYNQGKAAAMHSGFARALELGFTHALTIDTDGQHDTADAVRLCQHSAAASTALIIGDRPGCEGYPLRSRLGRTASNALVKFISGASVGDTQCGLRVYPLGVVTALATHSGRYAFETEIIVRAAWANVPIVCVPVRCIYDLPAGRITHFRLLHDSLSAAAMHVRLLTRSLLPWPVAKLHPRETGDATGTLFERGHRWLNPLRAWRMMKLDPRERERIGASIGWGLFVGTQPPLGYKGALCLLLAKVFRLQPLIVLATSSLSTPPLGFVLWAAAIIVGHVLLHGSMPGAEQYDIAARGAWTVMRALALEWIVGGIVFGATLGLTAWLITTAIVRTTSSPPRRSARAA